MSTWKNIRGLRVIAGLQGRVSAFRIRQSAEHLGRVCELIPAAVPHQRDLTWLELRRVTPAILAGAQSAEVGVSLLDVFNGVFGMGVTEDPSALHSDKFAPNFVTLTGLAVACEPTLLPAGLRALAFAAVLSSGRWYLPRRSIRKISAACCDAEWDSVPTILAQAALRSVIRRCRSFRLWRCLLEQLARSGEWAKLLDEAFNQRRYVTASQKALRRSDGDSVLRPRFERISHRDTILAAELIGRSHGELDRFEHGSARNWMLPLVERSTGCYLERTMAAHFLCEWLRRDGPVLPNEVAEAMERGIAPTARNDYSNFRKAFSMKSWEILHDVLKHWAIITELECFVCEQDRVRFWHHFGSNGESK